MLKILTFNLWGRFGPRLKERWAAAARCIAELGCDILCLQEVTDPMLLHLISETANKNVVLADPQGSGLAVLSNLSAADNGLVEYQARSFLERYARKFIWVKLVTGAGFFVVTNTHLAWLPGDDKTRMSQAGHLCRFVLQKNLPAVLCGDFNCEYKSAPLSALRQSGFSDALESLPDEHKPTWDNRHPYIQSHLVKFPDRRIDLILCSKKLRESYFLKEGAIVLDKPAGGIFPSDHYGVIAGFRERLTVST